MWWYHFLNRLLATVEEMLYLWCTGTDPLPWNRSKASKEFSHRMCKRKTIPSGFIICHVNGIDIYWFMQSWAKHCVFRILVLGSLADLQKGRWHKWFHLTFGSLSISFRSQAEWAKGSQLCTDGHQSSTDWTVGLVTVGSPCFAGDQSGDYCVKVTFGWRAEQNCLCRDWFLCCSCFEKSSFSGEFWFSKLCNAGHSENWIEIDMHRESWILCNSGK